MVKKLNRVQVRVEELERSRSGRSLCYIDPKVIDALGLTIGNIIEISGKKKNNGNCCFKRY